MPSSSIVTIYLCHSFNNKKFKLYYLVRSSFGTDSPLDLDIKERLMHQALRSVSVLPDDEQAYLQHHKNEAEKRLMARREKDREERQQEIAGTNGRMAGRPVGVMRKITKSPAPSSSSSSSSPITFNDTLTTALGGGMCNGNGNGSGSGSEIGTGTGGGSSSGSGSGCGSSRV